VNVGDEVDGATVAAIKPTTVTLEINGQRKTYHCGRPGEEKLQIQQSRKGPNSKLQLFHF